MSIETAAETIRSRVASNGSSLGATVMSVAAAKNGFISRGVLVDVPRIRGVDWLERGEGVMPEDILAAEERCGFKVEEGDIEQWCFACRTRTIPTASATPSAWACRWKKCRWRTC